jgi:hypothetical protein
VLDANSALGRAVVLKPGKRVDLDMLTTGRDAGEVGRHRNWFDSSFPAPDMPVIKCDVA